MTSGPLIRTVRSTRHAAVVACPAKGAEMTNVQLAEQRGRARGAMAAPIGWGLAAAGALFLFGGMLHPHEDPPGASLEERLHVMYDDPAWYPAHALLLAGTALIAVSLVLLVRRRLLADVPAAHLAATVAAAAAVLASLGMVLHLFAAGDAGRIAAGRSTPLTDVHLVVETITVPLFGFAIAVLAVVGAATRSLGNWLTALFGVVGGGAYALASGTAAFTDALDPLFPISSVIALWALGTGAWLLLRARANPAAASPAPLTAPASAT